MFSEKFKISFTKTVTDSFGSYVRAILISILVFIMGGFSGAFVIANSINPRVSAVEFAAAVLKDDFSDTYFGVNDRLEKLENNTIETKTQIQMLILYQIPATERERLRSEAEKKIEDGNN